MSFFLRGLDAAILWYFFLLNASHLLLLFVGFLEVRVRRQGLAYDDLREIFRSPLTPPVSVLLPARDEAVGIAASVGALLRLDYPRYEVIVVNDGSDDATLPALIAAFKLVREAPEAGGTLPTARLRGVYRSMIRENLTVIDKEGGGTSDALNAGLNAARHPYFCSLEAGEVLEPDALLRLMRGVLESPVRVVGIGAAVRAADGFRSPLSIFQAVENFRSFVGAPAGFSRFNGLMTLSGAFAMFERDTVVAAGGYRTDIAGTDMELVTRLHRRLREGGERGYGILFVSDPVCSAEAPGSLGALSRRRRLWQRGLLEVLGRNKGMLADQRYGAIGLLTLPFLLVFEGWGVPLEVLGYILFLAGPWRGAAGWEFMRTFLFIAVFCGGGLSLAGVLIGEVSRRHTTGFGRMLALILFALLENICYRPVTAVMRLLGLLDRWR